MSIEPDPFPDTATATFEPVNRKLLTLGCDDPSPQLQVLRCFKRRGTPLVENRLSLAGLVGFYLILKPQEHPAALFLLVRVQT
jgi:hypothetical protein